MSRPFGHDMTNSQTAKLWSARSRCLVDSFFVTVQLPSFFQPRLRLPSLSDFHFDSSSGRWDTTDLPPSHTASLANRRLKTPDLTIHPVHNPRTAPSELLPFHSSTHSDH